MTNRIVWDQFYQKLNVIFNGVLAISMIPFALVFLDIQKNDPPSMYEGMTHTALKMSLMFLSLGVLGISNWFWRKHIGQVSKASDIESKLEAYLSERLKHLAVIELSAIVAVVGYFLLKEFIFVIIYLGVLFVFSQYRPRFSKVCKDLLEKEEDVINWIEQG
ncbi:hypothetical protein [Marinoscillum sp. MHG1-6]|uniref:hypothetical protein n=1 Tax=Marinoscillum sp. MHG1-6 TaxID=2959627 RepID=UPI0021574999|nr:hypothetical protein [Marinoscillum sp. MHG1-6]